VQQRRMIVDVVAVVAVALLGALVAVAPFLGLPPYVVSCLAVVLAGTAVATFWIRMVARPDHLKAVQSQAILDIANESLSFMRQGLTPATAQEVCRMAAREMDAAAVAITDRETVLGFAGVGEDHHTVGGPIITRATHEALEMNEHRILWTKEEIGCPKADCLLRAAIVVPLEMRGTPVGTLKFYYSSPRQLDETQVTTVEGLARLLSTQLELSELERQTELACRMELKALQSQINPHFLFNTINAIASLIRTDPPRARELLREFATFYRRTLENSEELIPLAQELDYVRRYLAFERARFGEDRILFAEDVPPRFSKILVPAFVVQPLVENAVQHGIRPAGPLHVKVAARLDDAGHACVTVADDGRGIPAGDLPHVFEPGFGRGMGIALKNVDDRLKGHFGPDSGISIASVEDEGTTVTLTLMLKPGAEADL
jgi:two-component system, LytTR family, sensor histidine kinase LytS